MLRQRLSKTAPPSSLGGALWHAVERAAAALGTKAPLKEVVRASKLGFWKLPKYTGEEVRPVVRALSCFATEEKSSRQGTLPWKPVVTVLAAGAMLMGNSVKAEGDEGLSDDEDSEQDVPEKEANEDDKEDKEEDEEEEEEDKYVTDRDRKQLLRAEPPNSMNPLAYYVDLHVKHGFEQKEICNQHGVAKRTLIR